VCRLVARSNRRELDDIADHGLPKEYFAAGPWLFVLVKNVGPKVHRIADCQDVMSHFIWLPVPTPGSRPAQ
jgi:hypothetical protein